MKKIALTLLLACSTFVSGCVNFTQPLPPDSMPDKNSGYIYGRFELIDETPVGHLRLGLCISSQTEDFIIQFQEDKKPAMIAVPPGTYLLNKVIFATYDYSKVGEKSLHDRDLNKAFTIEAGKAYYVGDYMAHTTVNYGLQSWQLTSARDNYQTTTEDLKQQAAFFSFIETQHPLSLNQQDN